MFQDCYKEYSGVCVDCICLTLNAEAHLAETLDAWYGDAPVRRLLVIDGGSKDDTMKILGDYPRVSVWVYPGMTTGKAWELLKDKVETPFFIWVDVGKIPKKGWFDEMMHQMELDKGDILGSVRFNYKDGRLEEDPVIRNPQVRLLGGPWLVWKEGVRSYHVDDDYAQRNIDIIIRRQLEESGGNYHLVTTTSHICYLPTPVTDKEELRRRHIQCAKGIVKYITPSYAQEHASYLLNDHWMLMMNMLDWDWIKETNPVWLPVLKEWRIRRLLIAKAARILYGFYMRLR